MGLYAVYCQICNKVFMWFSGDATKGQVCDTCRGKK